MYKRNIFILMLFSLAVIFCFGQTGARIADVMNIWVSPNGNISNNGTQQSPTTLNRAIESAQPGTTIHLMDGVYTDSYNITCRGVRGRPITLQAVNYQKAVFSGSGTRIYQWGPQDGYINLIGLWFKDCPLTDVNDDSSKYTSTVVYPHSSNWLIQDCRFTNVGTAMTINHNTVINRCVFEDIGFAAIWSWERTDGRGAGQKNNQHQSSVLKDSIIRRGNTLNLDPGYHGQGAKYGYTLNFTADGVIGYDNNGPALWLDDSNVNFTIQNSSFFGNHAGMTHAFGENRQYDAREAGMGLFIEISDSGRIINNYFYNNLSYGFLIAESGSNGGIVISGNTFLNNDIHIAFRAMNNRPEPQKLENVTVNNNTFGNWRSLAWTFTPYDSLNLTLAQYKISFSANNYFSNARNRSFASWLNTTARTMPELSSRLGVDMDAVSRPFTFNAGDYTVRSTTLRDVGRPSMWQVPSGNAENNNFNRHLAGKTVGDIITLPVTGYKPFVRQGNDWVTEIYDLQCRYIRLTANESQKQWIEENVRPYASIMQTNVTVRLTRVSEYEITAACQF